MQFNSDDEDENASPSPSSRRRWNVGTPSLVDSPPTTPSPPLSPNGSPTTIPSPNVLPPTTLSPEDDSPTPPPSDQGESDEEDPGNVSEASSSGASAYSTGPLLRHNRKFDTGTPYDRVLVKTRKPARAVGPRKNSLGLYTLEETKRIFVFLFKKNFMNYMKGKPVAKLMSHLNVRGNLHLKINTFSS